MVSPRLLYPLDGYLCRLRLDQANEGYWEMSPLADQFVVGVEVVAESVLRVRVLVLEEVVVRGYN